MKETHVVTCFLEHEGKVLLLKRSDQVGSYQQRWAGVSGYLEPENTPLEQALEELGEEVGLAKEDLKLVKEGLPLDVPDTKMDKKWVVHPFRFYLEDTEKINTDWENTEYRWVIPDDIKKYQTVPNLWEAWEQIK